MKRINSTYLIGREVIVGLGTSRGSLVILYDNKGVTFYAAKDGIRARKKEEITERITPPGVVRCEEAGLLNREFLFLKLGIHRLLAASYIEENGLHIVYNPDEQEFETKSNPFVERCIQNK